jgi:hypothetical protein
MPTSPPGRHEDLHREAAVAQSKMGLLMRIKARATLNQDDPSVPAASSYINIINKQAKMLNAASELGFTSVSRPRVYGGHQRRDPPSVLTRPRQQTRTTFRSMSISLALPSARSSTDSAAAIPTNPS